MDFNNKYHFTGHVFESRYTACLIEDDRYFLEVSRYIHLNPVKAKMVREPLDYEYSSYGKFVNDHSHTAGSCSWMSWRSLHGAHLTHFASRWKTRKLPFLV